MQVVRWTLVLFCFLNAAVLHAQTLNKPKEPFRNNTVYLEVGGIAAYYSADSKFSPRIPLQGQAIYRIKRHEIGLGASLGWYTYYYPRTQTQDAYYQDIHSYVSGQLGYSYTTKHGIYLGAYFTPVLVDYGLFDFTPWGGLRIGYRF